VLQNATLLIPAAVVDQIVRYDVVPLPLARKGISGIGHVGGSTVVSVRLDGKPLSGSATGVLLKIPGDTGPLRYAVEIDRTGPMHTVERTENRKGNLLLEVQTAAGRLFSCLDTERLLASLGHT
jgi:hypothetical protein